MLYNPIAEGFARSIVRSLQGKFDELSQPQRETMKNAFSRKSNTKSFISLLRFLRSFPIQQGRHRHGSTR